MDVAEIPMLYHELVVSWVVECYWMFDDKNVSMHGNRRALKGYSIKIIILVVNLFLIIIIIV